MSSREIARQNSEAGFTAPKTAKLVNFASHQELEPEDREIGFSARVFAQVSLPYREPKGDEEIWQRKSGTTTLSVRPALFEQPDGTFKRAYPFGMIPRHALTWMATEAYNTKSPELELGRSMRQFMGKLGIAPTGKNMERLTEHLKRLFDSQIKVEGMAVSEHGSGEKTRWIHLADDLQLWFSTDDHDTLPLWRQTVTLSDQFYRSILESPVPLDLKALRVLGSSPMRLDLYVWLSYRMSYLENTTHISWEQLSAQFGSQYSRLRAFKKAFQENLRDVMIIYPDLNVEATDDHLILRRSNTHIPKLPGAKRSKLILQGDKRVVNE